MGLNLIYYTNDDRNLREEWRLLSIGGLVHSNSSQVSFLKHNLYDVEPGKTLCASISSL